VEIETASVGKIISFPSIFRKALNLFLSLTHTFSLFSADKGGSFIGKIYTKEGKDWALQLVERGMAALHAPSVAKYREEGD
jgi:endonuclease YncB( thermonuclease family)